MKEHTEVKRYELQTANKVDEPDSGITVRLCKGKNTTLIEKKGFFKGSKNSFIQK